MRRLRRILWRIAIGVVLLVLIAGLIGYFSIDHIIRTTVQDQGSQSLQLKTTLGSASLALLGGKLALKNLTVDRPDGFVEPFFIKVGDIDVAVHYRDLFKSPIHIDQLEVDNADIVLERIGKRFNVRVVMDQAAPDSDLKLVIDHLKIDHPSLTIRSDLPGIKDELHMNLPSMTLDDVGVGDNGQGMSFKQVAMELVTSVMAKATQSGKLPPELQTLMQGDVKDFSHQLGQRFKTALDKVAPQSELGNDVEQLLTKGQSQKGASHLEHDVKQEAGSLFNKVLNRVEGKLNGNPGAPAATLPAASTQPENAANPPPSTAPSANAPATSPAPSVAQKPAENSSGSAVQNVKENVRNGAENVAHSLFGRIRSHFEPPPANENPPPATSPSNAPSGSNGMRPQ